MALREAKNNNGRSVIESNFMTWTLTRKLGFVDHQMFQVQLHGYWLLTSDLWENKVAYKTMSAVNILEGLNIIIGIIRKWFPSKKRKQLFLNTFFNPRSKQTTNAVLFQRCPVGSWYSLIHTRVSLYEISKQGLSTELRFQELTRKMFTSFGD